MSTTATIDLYRDPGGRRSQAAGWLFMVVISGSVVGLGLASVFQGHPSIARSLPFVLFPGVMLVIGLNQLMKDRNRLPSRLVVEPNALVIDDPVLCMEPQRIGRDEVEQLYLGPGVAGWLEARHRRSLWARVEDPDFGLCLYDEPADLLIVLNRPRRLEAARRAVWRARGDHLCLTPEPRFEVSRLWVSLAAAGDAREALRRWGPGLTEVEEGALLPFGL